MKEFVKEIDLGKMTDLQYMLDPIKQSKGIYILPLIIFCFFIILALIFLYVYRKPTYSVYTELKNKLFDLFFACGLLGLLWVFFSWQNISFFSSRAGLIFIFLVFVLWGLKIVYFRFIRLPKKIQVLKEKENFQRFLPKKKYP